MVPGKTILNCLERWWYETAAKKWLIEQNPSSRHDVTTATWNQSRAWNLPARHSPSITWSGLLYNIIAQESWAPQQRVQPPFSCSHFMDSMRVRCNGRMMELELKWKCTFGELSLIPAWSFSMTPLTHASSNNPTHSLVLELDLTGDMPGIWWCPIWRKWAFLCIFPGKVTQLLLKYKWNVQPLYNHGKQSTYRTWPWFPEELGVSSWQLHVPWQ